jgi:transposase
MDRAGWHTTNKINCFNNITIMPLPPYSPELNPVEQLWQNLKQRYLANRCFKDYDDILDKSCDAWNDVLKEDGFIKNLCTRGWAILI